MVAKSLFLPTLILGFLSCPAFLLAQPPVQSTVPPEDGRPHMRFGAERIPSYGGPVIPATAAGPAAGEPEGSEEAAPGLPLPNYGNFWALDLFDGKPELVHLRYSNVTYKTHSASNFFKAQVEPFIAKMKATVVIQGRAATVRLHNTTPVFYVRGMFGDQADAPADAGSGPTSSQLALIRLKVKKHERVASTMDFTQVTGTAHRSQNTVPFSFERLPGTDWYKVTPSQPLSPGEYAFMPLFQGQNLFSPTAFDFAIDPKAPQNREVILQNAAAR